jgi:hypothetical protein
MRKITVDVTYSHIESGICSDGNRCPIALAIREQHNLDVSVSHFAVEAYGFDVELPQEAADFVMEFDFDRSVKPFTFELEIPE